MIIIDDREPARTRYIFPGEETRVERLDFGDYERFNIVIERKSCKDLIGTLCNNLDRFKRELIRAEDAGVTLHVIVEATYQKVANSGSVVNWGGERVSVPKSLALLARYYDVNVWFAGSHRLGNELARNIFDF